MVSLSFQFLMLFRPFCRSHYFRRQANSAIERIWMWITSCYRGLSVMDGSGTKPKDIPAGITGFVATFAQTRRVPSPAFLFSLVGWFFNLPLLSHHCPCNPALVPRIRALAPNIELSAIDFTELFGRLLAEATVNVNNVRIYIPARINVTRLVPPLISR